MELIKWLSVADRHAKMYLDHQLSPFHLNSSHHMYVVKICENPGITQDQFSVFIRIPAILPGPSPIWNRKDF